MKPGEKIPQDQIECPLCHRPYSFIRARVTLKNPYRNMCLECGSRLEREGKL